MKTVAIVGTNGVPAQYGGFETLADNLVQGLSDRYQFIVYCSKTPRELRLTGYHNARLIYLPLKANGWQSVIYDFLCSLHAFMFADIFLLLGPGLGFILFLNKLFKRNLIVNFGGLNEWEREKYSPFLKFYSRASSHAAAKSSTINVADNGLLKESLAQSFNAGAVIIRYGGDHAKVPTKQRPEWAVKYHFTNKRYFVSVARAQVDNNIHLLIEAFKAMPEHQLVVVSNWNVSEYGKETYRSGQGIPNVTLLDAIYDLEELNHVRGSAWVYVHTHSRCGTAPSLVEAICLDLPIISFDVPTNRETTGNMAMYFSSAMELQVAVRSLDDAKVRTMRDQLKTLAVEEYRWAHIHDQYAAIFEGTTATS